MEVDKTYKLPYVGLRPARLPTFRQKFVFFDVTSCVNIDCINCSCARHASSVEQVSEHKSKGIGFKSHVRLTLSLEYILYMKIYDIYIYGKYIPYNARPYATCLICNSKFACFKDKPSFLTNIPLNSLNLFHVPPILALTDIYIYIYINIYI